MSGTADGEFVSCFFSSMRFFYAEKEEKMLSKLSEIKKQFDAQLQEAKDLIELEDLRVLLFGKNGTMKSILKEMGALSVEEKKAIGAKVNELKNEITDRITVRKKELQRLEMEKQINSVPTIDLSIPSKDMQGSYHPITLVQRQCENVFKSMGFVVEDYSEIVSDYECFESLNIPKFHPARDMQDTYYLENGQLLKTQTSAAQNAIYRKYRDALVNDGVPIKAIFPGRCFRNESTDACHENTFFQMEGIMVGENVSIANLIYFMKTMLSEVFRY